MIGQRIAIHAAKKPPLPILFALDSETVGAMESALDPVFGCHADPRWPRRLPLGAVVCTAILAGAQQCTGEPESYSDLFGDYSRGRWMWRLVDVEPIDPPIPVRGAQGIFQWARP